MKIGKPKDCTRIIGAPANWDEADGECSALPVVDIPTDIGNCMVSEWYPDEQELALLRAGMPIHLWVYGGYTPSCLGECWRT